MASAFRPSRIILVLAFGVLVVTGVLALRDDGVVAMPRAAPAAAAIASPRVSPTPIRAEPSPALAPAAPAEPAPHTLDPCAPLHAPELPPTFETEVVNGITVAWDPAITIESAPLAYLTRGFLVQAGLETNTTPRDQLAVVVYASSADFRAQTGAPSWAGGLYDGAVRIFASERDDLGVVLSALRHEVMHAQLHAAVGCMPAWLDEGVAQAFAREVPETQWLAMLSGRAQPALVRLQVSSIQEAAGDSPELAYAQSFAMVLFAQGRGHTLHEMIRETRRLGPRAPAKLWSEMFPGVADRDVIDALALRIFALPSDRVPEVEAAGVCCTHRAGQLSCVGAHARPEHRRYWVEEHRMCRVVSD